MFRFSRLAILVGIMAGLFLFFTINFCSRNIKDQELMAEELVIDPLRHPYGRPVAGILFWEKDMRFRKLLLQHRLFVRLAAFQTTLPDPLPGEEFNVAHAARLLAGKIVLPGEVFSMNAAIGPYSRERGFREGPAYVGNNVITTIGGGVCKVATTLYNVAVLANLKIVERRPHGMLVPYVPPGQDATVSFGTVDFKFLNTTGSPILIWAESRRKTLYMAFYGRAKPPRVKWGHQVLNRTPFNTVYRYNPNLGPGEEKIIIPGASGIAVKSWVEICYPNGRKERRNLGVDYYRPMTRVIEKGPPPPYREGRSPREKGE